MAQEMIMKGTVRAVCTSPAKGTEKRPVSQGIFIKNFGIKDDAHAGKWHRQVSLLSYDKVEEFNARGAQVVDGDFGEDTWVAVCDLQRASGTSVTGEVKGPEWSALITPRG